MSKITQQPYSDKQKNHRYDSTRLKICYSAERKHKKQNNIARQSVKLNVLNMIDGANNKDFTVSRPSTNYKKIYSKCFSNEEY